MLHLMFEGHTPSYSYHCQPSDGYHLQGSEIRDFHGNPVATCEDNSWVSHGSRYVHLRCRGPVVVTFENPASGASESVGPFQQLDIRGCGIQCGNEFLAHLDDDDQWHSVRTGESWPIVTLSVLDAVLV